MTRKRHRGLIPIALLASFAAGVLVDGWFRTYGPPRPVGSDLDFLGSVTTATKMSPKRENRDLTPTISAPKTPAPIATSGDSPNGRLRLPLDGVDLESLKGGFAERRGGDRPHEAVDMLAPRNTPIHAVDNGTIAKLFTSKAGGLTIYQFDPTGHFAYYYAHLERYADGLTDGQPVTQGQILGYVGTSGNAPPDTPHLHFGVFELNADQHWWQGRPIDPYLVFKNRS